MQETEQARARAEIPPSSMRDFGGQVNAEPVAEEPALFASSWEEPRRPSGLRTWLAAAVCLVLGIVIGFTSGYRAGQGASEPPPAAQAAPTSGTTSGQPFSESSVSDPVRLQPDDVVPAPPTPEATPPARERQPSTSPERQAAPKPAPAPERRRSTPAPAQTPQPAVATGPGSLQILSRPAGAQVIVDGKTIGKTPLSIGEVSAGTHSVRLELPGFNGWETTVDVKAGAATRVAASLEQ